MRTRPPTSTRSRGVPSAATAGAAVSVAASAAPSRAAAVREARAGASSRGGRWQGLDAERGGGGRRRHLLEPLAVRRESVSLQGLGGVSLRLAGKLVARGCLNAIAPGQLVHIVDQLTGGHFLIDPPSPESTGRCGGDATAAASPPPPPPLSPEWLKAFLAEFEDVVCPSKVLLPVGTDVENHIKISGPPIASRFRRLDE
jgi:hypothetical protein